MQESRQDEQVNERRNEGMMFRIKVGWIDREIHRQGVKEIKAGIKQGTQTQTGRTGPTQRDRSASSLCFNCPEDSETSGGRGGDRVSLR